MEEAHEMHSEDDKALLEKNKKRTLKTHAQVDALEKFYNEHKYPKESLKLQLAESIGLTEKQVSGWFCHRRLKDKRLMSGDNYIVSRQDRSSGVIQDGHRQDSCGSTKQGDGKNFDMKEVESGRLHHPECSGSSSSLRNVSNDHKGDNVFEVLTARYIIPKLPLDVKTKSGPSGYLKVKGQVENGAITAVKRQLGKHYIEDGPPLGVEFDPLPPGAFESSMQDPVDETRYTGKDVPPASPDISRFHEHPKFGKGCEYNSNMASRNSSTIRTSSKVPLWSDNPDNYVHKKLKQNIPFSCNGAYYPVRSSYVEFPEVSPGDRSVSEDRQGIEVMRMSSVSRGEQELSFHKYNNDVVIKSDQRENIENGSSNLTMKSFRYQNSFDKVHHRGIVKDGKTYAERRIINENRVMIPVRSDATAQKRMRDGFPHHSYLKKSSALDITLGSYRVVRCAAEVPYNFCEDET